MTRTSNVLAALATAAILIAAPLSARAGAGDDALVSLLVDSANTPQEHQALAQYYREKAQESHALAERHRSMANHYGGGNVATRKAGKEHCERLVALNEDLAAQYEGLAKLHEAEAAKAK